MNQADLVDPEDLLTEKEAASLMRVSMRTMQAWRTKRRGPPFMRLGRIIRYSRRALNEWMKANTQFFPMRVSS